MHREIVKSVKGDRMSVLGLSLGLTVLLVVIVGIANFIYNRFEISYSGYIAFLLYILVGIYVYRRRILEYSYTLKGNILVFESLVGKRSREIARVSLDRILYFCPLAHERRDKNTRYRSHFIAFGRYSPDNYVLAFEKDDRIHRIVFKPSRKLVDLIKDS
ncbi:MAG: hypothetical protein GX340_04770 [Clostridiales bacterium]|jgi:hypothetical protein|nr:hypothetical protein [Clostridiales bacterium]